MRARHLYLALCVVGFAGPTVAFWPWFRVHGLDPGQFVTDLFANGVSAFFGLDVVVSAIVLFAFIAIEGGRLNLRGRWMPVAATLVIGVSLGLPLFLYQRQAHLDRTRSM